MSDTHEIAETISDAAEHHHQHLTPEAFRRRMGMAIGFLACGLAITAVGGSKAMQETINANIEASDDYAFYQSKTLRKEVLQAASDSLETILQTIPGLSDDAKTGIKRRQDAYAKQMAHWDSAPDENNGIKELLAKAKAATARREEANERNDRFEFAEAMLQISVVTASTSVLLASRVLAGICLAFAAVGAVAAVSGFVQLL